MSVTSRVPQLFAVLTLVGLTACSEEIVSSPPLKGELVSTLIVDGGDGLSYNFPQIWADLQLRAEAEIVLSQPVPHAVTRVPIDRFSVATPPENVSVSAGWNSSGRARLSMSGLVADAENVQPSSAVLRGAVVTQYDASGNAVSSAQQGTMMGAMSPDEWFATHPVSASLASANVAPAISALVGAMTVSDARMAGAGVSMRALNVSGFNYERRKLRMARVQGLTTDAIYLRLRDSASAAGSPSLTWVLRELRVSNEQLPVRPNSPRIREVQRIIVHRLIVQAALPAASTNASSGTAVLSSPTRRTFIIPEDPEDPWNPPPPPPDVPPTPPSPPPGLPGLPVPLPTPAPVVFQHGYTSNGEVWNGMRSRLRGILNIDDRAYTVPTIPGLEAASHSLLAAVRDEAGFSRTVLLAHSAGGVISRRVAQLDPARVAGIITVGTPHAGALISERGPETGAGILAAVAGSFYIGPCVSGLLAENSTACKSFSKLAIVTGAFIAGEVYGERMGQPGSNDLNPDSPFIQQVNSAPESFPRVGITHRVANSGALARYLGERLGTNEYDGYSADLAAREYNITRRSALFNFILATVQLAMLSEYEMGFSRWQLTTSCGPVYSSFGNCGGVTEPYLANRFYNSYAQYLFQQQALAAGIYLSLTIANGVWNWGTTDQQGGDAFIASASQFYPNVVGSPFLPVNVESDRSFNGLATPAHGGETRSTQTANVFESQLQLRFGVQRRAF